MERKDMEKWIRSIKEGLRQTKEFKKADEETLNSTVMDGLFEGFIQGELHRGDLVLAGSILGIELSEEFVNDPHPDPIDLKKGR